MYYCMSTWMFEKVSDLETWWGKQKPQILAKEPHCAPWGGVMTCLQVCVHVRCISVCWRICILRKVPIWRIDKFKRSPISPWKSPIMHVDSIFSFPFSPSVFLSLSHPHTNSCSLSLSVCVDLSLSGVRVLFDLSFSFCVCLCMCVHVCVREPLGIYVMTRLTRPHTKRHDPRVCVCTRETGGVYMQV